MGKFITKYSVGDKVYIVSYGSLVSDTRVELAEISGIKLGGKYWETYEFYHGSQHRGEKDIYTDLETAKKQAIKLVKEKAAKTIESIQEKELDKAEVQ